MKKTALLLFITFWTSILYSQNNNFIRGVDLSFTQQIEDLGGVYKVNGVAKEALDILKENGANYIRLRLWHTPKEGYCGLDKTISFAKRAKAKGYKFLLDLHYSDWWADPGKQNKPAAWANLPYNNLKDSIYSYTKNVITAFKNQNALPDMVQFGNEISNGMLWPEGKNNSSAGWNRLGGLLKEGITALRDAAVGIQIKIMLHIDCGGDNSKSVWWLDNIINQNVEFDVIGLSFYPWWHGTLNALENNLNDLAIRYNKEINIVETAYPWTLSWNDSENNIVGSQNQLLTDYPATVQGQEDYMRRLIRIVENIPNGKGNGFFYWAPDWITAALFGSAWENMTFFDFSGEVLRSITVFNPENSTGTNKNKLPFSFILEQNYPNPFNPGTIIKFRLKEASNVQLKIFDLLGREVASLVDEYKSIGEYTIQFFAQKFNLPSGVYYYKIVANGAVQTMKMIYLK